MALKEKHYAIDSEIKNLSKMILDSAETRNVIRQDI